ncbi:MAG: protein-L-isoaspartate(D-aspartate) O-methyltransferase [Spirochaetaceae bacterium]|nr:protein-L-isoaspartate(D-aspartate) O-methyltransferase [Spirochaetaceae bacterium]
MIDAAAMAWPEARRRIPARGLRVPVAPPWPAIAGCLILLLAAPAVLTAQDRQEEREEMVNRQIAARGVNDERVLQAMRTVPRHRFVPERLSRSAYNDHPLPIGEGQTISQPYIVALMTETLEVEEDDRVLEIGTGSAYQAAVLAELVAEVYSIEIRGPLAESATALLEELEYANVQTKHADGYYGWPEAAPFDHIMITAAVDHVPPPLLEQLAAGGRLILPLGNPFAHQSLVVVTKLEGGFRMQEILGVLFVPMTGAALN